MVTRYEASGGLRVYCIPVRAFPMLITNCYVLIAGDYAALVDTGSGLGENNLDLHNGMAALRDEWGERIDWGDLKRIVITHAHIDHFGGLGFVREHTTAPIAVHELDRRVLTSYDERRVLSSRSLSSFLWRAGVSQERHALLMDMYGWSKGLFRSVEVETILRDGDRLDDCFVVYHTPGHCPGQICLQIDDLLLCADHVLPRISPHLAPESITPWTGLDHYLQSLHRIAAVPGIRLALGGHDGPFENLQERIAQIQASHQRKLQQVLNLCSEPRTIAELTQAIYPVVEGYHILLAIEEIGAHVEYLDQRGELAISNLDQIAVDERIAPQYRKA